MGEIFLIGESIGGPSKGGCKGYHESLPTPTWDELLIVLASNNINVMNIMFLGKVGSDGQCGGTGWGKVTRADVQRVPLAVWDVNQGPLKAITTDPDYTNQFAQMLLHLGVEPTHTVGIYIEKLS